MERRSNKARRDKDSILADAKNLLLILHPAIQRMPKIERIEGAPQEMKAACYGIIRHFTIAKECPEARMEHIRQMLGEWGALLAAFELCIDYGLLTDRDKLAIARNGGPSAGGMPDANAWHTCPDTPSMNDLIKNFTYISNDMENNDIHERINALESRRLELLTRASKSDRAALDYVKSLPGFREAYPEFAADAEQVAAAEQDVAGTLAEVKAEWRLHIGEPVEAGAVIVHDGIRYTVLQAHTLQEDWEPGSVPALYKREGVDGEPADEWPEWVQPTGSHDVYAAGAKVTFDGKHYISLIDNNSWSPAAYPAGWSVQD